MLTLINLNCNRYKSTVILYFTFCYGFMKKLLFFALIFNFLIANLSWAQDPKDIAEEVFENLLAKDYKNLAYYRIRRGNNEFLFDEAHHVDTAILNWRKYELMYFTDISVTQDFITKDVLDNNKPTKIQQIIVDYNPQIPLRTFDDVYMKDAVQENNDSTLAYARIHFTNGEQNYVLALSLIRYNNAYYFTEWFDFLPQLYQDLQERKAPIKDNKEYQITFQLDGDVILDLERNQQIPFNEYTYIYDVARLKAALGFESDGFEFNNLLSFNGEKGRFGYLDVDKDFDKINYKDVASIPCDERYLNDVLQLGGFLFKDPQGHYYKFLLESISEEEKTATLTYVRLN